jgi:hypothetical protein
LCDGVEKKWIEQKEKKGQAGQDHDQDRIQDEHDRIQDEQDRIQVTGLAEQD